MKINNVASNEGLLFTFQTNCPNYHSCFYSTHASNLLERSRHFWTVSSSLALTLPSSRIVTIILSQLSSFCRYWPSTVSSLHFHDLLTYLSPTRVCIFIFKQTFWNMVIPLLISFKLTFSWQIPMNAPSHAVMSPSVLFLFTSVSRTS